MSLKIDRDSSKEYYSVNIRSRLEKSKDTVGYDRKAQSLSFAFKSSVGISEDIEQYTRRQDKTAGFIEIFSENILELKTKSPVKLIGEVHPLGYWRKLAVSSAVELNEDIKELFIRLRSEWYAETMFSSSATELIMNKNYQSIIGLGSPVIPYLIQALNEDGWVWDWALSALTRDNPVPEQDKGNSKVVRMYWMDWAKARGII